MWKRNEAIEVCQKVEAKLSDLGFHCALAGSVLTKGESKKDLDLIVYPHTKSLAMATDFQAAKSVIKNLFAVEEIKDCGATSQIRDDKQVSWIKTLDGKRIDFFFSRITVL